MKHPALTRVFAVVLVILCLTMLLAGVFGRRSAAEEKQHGLDDIARLEDRMAEYRTVSLALDGTISYAEASEALGARQEQHDADASQHKIDLATYTATRSGLNEGTKALDEAEAAFYEGKEQYEAGLREFEKQEAAFWEGYNQFVTGMHQLEAGKAQLQLMVDLVSAVRWELDNLKYIDELILDEENEDEQALMDATLAAYDGAIYALDAAMGLTESLKDQGGISAEQMETLKTVLAENSDLDLEEIELSAITAEQIQQFQDAVAETTGMSVEELRQQLQTARDSISLGEEDTPATEEQFAQIRAVYSENRESVSAAISAIEARVAEYESTLAATQAQLDAAQAEIDALMPMMQQGKSAIEQTRQALNEAGDQLAAGEEALWNSRAEIWWNMGQLSEQEETLQQEKEALEQDAEELKAMQDDAQAQKELEQRQKTLRLILMDRDEVRERVERGMEIYSAALAGTDQMRQDTERQYQGRTLAYLLMIAGAVCGFLGIPAAFEGVRSRFLLIAPVFLCLLCAAAAEGVCVYMGRGHSYSALAVVIFALIQMLVILPRKKSNRV